MMYGFGDDQNPYTESVDILEDLVIEFITEMVSRRRAARPCTGIASWYRYCTLHANYA